MAARPQTKPATTGDVLTVLCKIPQGFSLQVHELQEVTEVTMGGSRTVKQYFPSGEPFHLNGSAHAQNEGPHCRTVGQFAITEGVPRDLWERWYDQNRMGDFCKNMLICAFDNTEDAVSFAKENRTVVRTGLERLNPNDLPNLDPRFKLKTAEENPSEIGYIEE